MAERASRPTKTATGIPDAPIQVSTKTTLAPQIDGQGVKNYGSQGQQKTFVIALKMAQYALLGEEKGLAPLLLPDYIFDKLDIRHRLRAIARMLDERVKGQVLITDTSLSAV